MDSLYTFYKEERPVFLNECGWQNNDDSNVVTPGAKGIISGYDPYCSPWRMLRLIKMRISMWHKYPPKQKGFIRSINIKSTDINIYILDGIGLHV